MAGSVFLLARWVQTEYGDSQPGGFARLSPFTEVVCQPDDVVLVRIGDEQRMLHLVSIDEVPAEDILAASRNRYDELWEKRFVEDIVEVLESMGNPPGETVKLVLRDPESGATRTIDDAPMTLENRQKMYVARYRNQ
jgi:serine/threonine-protein kinase